MAASERPTIHDGPGHGLATGLAERRTGSAALLSAVLLVGVGTAVGVVGAAVLLGLARHLGLELPQGSAGHGGLLAQLAGRISP
jgi:hypothetical protein